MGDIFKDWKIEPKRMRHSGLLCALSGSEIRTLTPGNHHERVAASLVGSKRETSLFF